MSPVPRWLDDEEMATWRALVAGEYTIVESVERDGKRLLLARKNEPDVGGLAKLTTLEAACAYFTALGHPQKLIGYELGITPSAAMAKGSHPSAMTAPRRAPHDSVVQEDRSGQGRLIDHRGLPPGSLRETDRSIHLLTVANHELIPLNLAGGRAVPEVHPDASNLVTRGRGGAGIVEVSRIIRSQRGSRRAGAAILAARIHPEPEHAVRRLLDFHLHGSFIQLSLSQLQAQF
mgnify:CR=1 FL=1